MSIMLHRFARAALDIGQLLHDVGRRQTGEARVVRGSFGVTGPHQDTAWHGGQRKNVSWLYDIGGPGVRRHGSQRHGAHARPRCRVAGGDHARVPARAGDSRGRRQRRGLRRLPCAGAGHRCARRTLGRAGARLRHRHHARGPGGRQPRLRARHCRAARCRGHRALRRRRCRSRRRGARRSAAAELRLWSPPSAAGCG